MILLRSIIGVALQHLIMESYYSRITMFSLRKRRTGSLMVITSADVQISAQYQVKTEKKVITSVGVRFLAQNRVRTKKRKGHYVRRHPIFRRTFGHFMDSSEDKLFFLKKEDMFSKRRRMVSQCYSLRSDKGMSS